MNECALCDRINVIQNHIKDDFFVHEFSQSILVVGEHQMCAGYCVLVLKSHVTELHDLPLSKQNAFYQELMQAGRAIFQAFRPQKMNYAAYGNMVPHLHWHIIPRFMTDDVWPKPIWTGMADFSKYATQPDQAKKVAAMIQQYLL